jgi:4-hydroxy-3-methylbut-2-enyl diphosphate reductase
MSENITNENNISMADYMDEIDASLRLPHTGDIVTGKVDQVNDSEVIVNMGCKKDGILTANEVSLEEGQKLTDLFKVGDEVQAKVIKTDDSDGGILLSKKRLEVNEHWNEINEALENKTPIDVKVVKAVKGGVIAVYKEVSGFIPLSQLSNKYVESADEFLGQVLSVKVTRVDQRRGRAVFSHKAVLAEERQKQIDQIWAALSVDDIVEGTVMRFTDYGAFVDLGGIDGLLHISEISWGKLKHPDEVLHIGQKINVKILSMNKEKGKISLGLKQTTPEPWSVIEDNYHVDQIVRGKVVQLKEYGAFVELEPGLDGLVHISEVANKRVANIGDELTVGQMVNARILDIDTERRRISLSIKDAIGEEAEIPAEEAPVEDTPAEEDESSVVEVETAVEKAEHHTPETEEEVVEESAEIGTAEEI